jgi:3-phosphoshikimate 1-carboxyvinyltransferase
MANGLNQLGVLVRRDDDEWEVCGTGGKLFAPRYPIPVGNAGTTLRFFLSLASLADGTVQFDAAPRMAERPNEELFAALRNLGVQATQVGNMPRYEVVGGGLSGGRLVIDQARSSQFLSSILLVAPYARGEVEIEVRGVKASESYVRMTVAVMKEFGVGVELEGAKSTYRVRAPQKYSSAEYTVEADASGASYGLAAVAIGGGEILVEGMRLDSLQGDTGFVEILRAMGCHIAQEASGVRIMKRRPLTGVTVDMKAMPDIVPTLASVALFANGPSRIRNVAHLRYKESDRLAAIGEEFRKLGADIAVLPDGLEITPSQLSGAQLDTYDDHRLAMSFALIGLRVPGVRIENPECVTKSFPRFWEEFEGLTS